jgi:CheY-like chemotaxis protein
MSPAALDVLLIEDDGPTQSFLRALCRRLALTVYSVTDGDAAVAYLARVEPAVIVLDLYLPKLNGFDVLEILRRQQPHLVERVIVVTAASEHDLELAGSLGRVHSLLRKPVDLDTLALQLLACAAMHRPLPRSVTPAAPI